METQCQAKNEESRGRNGQPRLVKLLLKIAHGSSNTPSGIDWQANLRV